MTKILGILGGMGPLASAEMLATLYEYNLAEGEQKSPIVIMRSDPSFPDRTESIVRGSHDFLITRLQSALEDFRRFGASKLVIACMTMHSFLPCLPNDIRRDIISLVDLTLQEVLRQEKRCLLLCTTGARIAGAFRGHDLWPVAAPYVEEPGEADQQIVHDLIYQIKRGEDLEGIVARIDSLLKKYAVDTFIAGCTEIHLVTKYCIKKGSSTSSMIVDPAIIFAINYQRLMNA